MELPIAGDRPADLAPIMIDGLSPPPARRTRVSSNNYAVAQFGERASKRAVRQARGAGTRAAPVTTCVQPPLLSLVG